MSPEKNQNSFDNICSLYEAWIINYRSHIFELPVFCVWYSEKNNASKLLTFKSGLVFSTNSLLGIGDRLSAHYQELNKFENLDKWIEEIKISVPVCICTYDLEGVHAALNSNTLDDATIECIAEFVNLFNDLAHQDEQNKALLKFEENKYIKEVWSYYYDFIFWPRFNDKEKFKAWDKPPLETDITKLLPAIIQLQKQFEIKLFKV